MPHTDLPQYVPTREEKQDPTPPPTLIGFVSSHYFRVCDSKRSSSAVNISVASLGNFYKPHYSVVRGRDSSVGIATGNVLDDRGVGFES
jgi:hypothetical protein